MKTSVAWAGDFNFLGGAGPDNDNAKSKSRRTHNFVYPVWKAGFTRVYVHTKDHQEVHIHCHNVSIVGFIHLVIHNCYYRLK